MTIKSRTNLLSDIATLLPDNNTQAISAADIRAVVGDGTDSSILRTTSGAISVPRLSKQPDHQEGQIWYDSEKKTLSHSVDFPDVLLNIGCEFWVRIFNDTGAVIKNGTPCYLEGASLGLGRPRAYPAKADTEKTRNAIGVATHDIPDQSEGILTRSGVVNYLDTTQWSPGTKLYLSPTVAGGVTDEYPAPDYYRTVVGEVLVQDDSNGTIFVDLNRYERSTFSMTAFFPLSGALDRKFFMTGTFREVLSNETGNVSGFDSGLVNQHLYIKVNSVALGGDIVVTGTSVSESTAVPVEDDTETITVDGTINELYQSDKKWLEITSIDVSGTTGINYDAGVLGYFDAGNRKFALSGYRLDVRSSSDTSDLRYRIRRVRNLGDKKFELVTLEDIGHDSTSNNGQIYDHIRTGDSDRSYTFSHNLLDNNREIVYKQGDFSTFFNDREFVIDGDNDEGMIIDFLGEPSGGASAIDQIALTVNIFT